MNLPDGYTATDGLTCPVTPSTTVDCIVRTSEGLGHSGPMRAQYQDWIAADFPGGIGAVVGYRLADQGEIIDTVSRWAE
jgi:hypothetical protein